MFSKANKKICLFVYLSVYFSVCVFLVTSMCWLGSPCISPGNGASVRNQVTDGTPLLRS